MEIVLRKAGDHPNKPRVIVSAPTGMASTLIDGITIDSALNFKFGATELMLSDQKAAYFRQELQDLKVIICDEFSLLGADKRIKIHYRLKQNFQTPITTLFGGIAMVLVGDEIQIPPVKASYIFLQPRTKKYREFNDVAKVWNQFSVVNLQENHRQGSNQHWANILNKIRTGNIDQEVIAALSSRVITDEERNKMLNACHIFYTNTDVNKHNCMVLNTYNTPLVKIKAVVVKPRNVHIQDHPTKGTVGKDTQFLRTFDVKIDARVMLVFNINTIDGLANGVMGIVKGILFFENGLVKCIIVQFDNEKVGRHQRSQHKDISSKYVSCNGTPIFRGTLEFLVPTKGSTCHTAKATVTQFPLRLAWANTAHKIQGNYNTQKL